MGIKVFAERLNTLKSQEKAAMERLEANAVEAKGILARIFERFPESVDESGRPVTCDGPEFTVKPGINVCVDQTNNPGGLGEVAYNISVRDDDGITHSYAQIRESDTAIYYWQDSAGERRTGTDKQDREILQILLEAERQQDN